MNLHSQSRLALVTSSTKGTGHTVAVALTAEGVRVIVNGRTEAPMGDAIVRLRTEVPDAQVKDFAGDLSSLAQVDALFSRFPKVDIPINNLSIFDPKPLEEIDDAEWQHLFSASVLSGAQLSRVCLPGIRTRNWGCIMFISSGNGVRIPMEMIRYGVTKTALLGLSCGLVELTAGTVTTVSAVLPGLTCSEGVDALVEKPLGGQSFETSGETFSETAQPTPLIKHFTITQETVGPVAYVASPLLSATTGAVPRVDGDVVKSVFQNAGPDKCTIPVHGPDFYVGRVAGAYQRDPPTACLLTRIVEDADQANRACPRPCAGGTPSTSSE